MLKLILPDHNVCDMEGAIRIASAIMPDVAIIETFQGGHPDTRYEKIKAGKWEAYSKRGFKSI